jgi:hypothetical protein
MGERSGRELGRLLLREGPHGVVVELPRQLLVGQGVAWAAATPTAPQMDVACRPRSKNTELRNSSS